MEKEITDLPVREESPNVSILIEESKIAIEVSWLDALDEFEIQRYGSFTFQRVPCRDTWLPIVTRRFPIAG